MHDIAVTPLDHKNSELMFPGVESQENGLDTAGAHYVVFLHISICPCRLQRDPRNDASVRNFLPLEHTSGHA